MQGKYFFMVLFVLVMVSSPALADLSKITGGSPVFIGERNLDISSGLQGCRVIGWWPAGSDLTTAPTATVTVIPTLEDSDIAFSYTIDPKIYTGYSGMWYCTDKKPFHQVFEVREPELAISVWDLDMDKDITGTTVPLTTNITYRVKTNLDAALQYINRPEITPADSFFSVNLTDPRGKELLSVYTGSYGKPDTLIIPFETHPYISSSPFDWNVGGSWNRLSRNAQGEFLYPPGTYTFTITQNLNRMQDLFTSAQEREGHVFASASVTFSEAPASGGGVTIPQSTPLVTANTSTPPPLPSASSTTSVPTGTEAPTRTTYAPVPFWVSAAGLVAALVLSARVKR